MIDGLYPELNLPIVEGKLSTGWEVHAEGLQPSERSACYEDHLYGHMELAPMRNLFSLWTSSLY